MARSALTLGLSAFLLIFMQVIRKELAIGPLDWIILTAG